jgi:putative intracellular protease/amidase
MWDLPDDENVQKVTASIYEEGGVVAAVCHGPAGLLNVKLENGDYLVDGKEVTGFTNEEEREVGHEETVPFLLETQLKERGATFKESEPFRSRIVVSNRLVTGQNPASAAGTARAVLLVLNVAEHQ